MISDGALVLAQASRKFGVLPSERLGILDREIALDLDNALALLLILQNGDLEDEDIEEALVGSGGGPRDRPRSPESRGGVQTFVSYH